MSVINWGTHPLAAVAVVATHHEKSVMLRPLCTLLAQYSEANSACFMHRYKHLPPERLANNGPSTAAEIHKMAIDMRRTGVVTHPETLKLALRCSHLMSCNIDDSRDFGTPLIHGACRVLAECVASVAKMHGLTIDDA